ncbi:helix-hairpin-helix domain-containing protein [Arthrobacter sp. LFS091]|uniref:helix-hairpin-helix domain-containing protein n=1 Tax=Arthrobacter sp. LFS091 TaxID=3229892 RepID=UPI003A7F6C47
MPRWSQDPSPDAAAKAVRQRFVDRVATGPTAPPLLELPEAGNQGGADPERAAPARLRWRTPWRVAALLAVLVVGFIGLQWWMSPAAAPTFVPLSPSSSSGSSPVPTAAAGLDGDASGTVLVHVAGAVKAPGVVSLPEGSRVFQAIEAAGGASPNANLGGLNLAEVLRDGTKVHVPALGEPPQGEPPVGTGGSGAASTPAGATAGGAARININTASVEELGTLPRVGPVMAQRIVDWRKEHGAFASVDELDAIDGIGPKLMESLKDLVAVDSG